MLSPITLVPDPVVLNPNQVLEFEQTALQNPFRTAMLVDEFRFRVGTVTTSGYDPIYFPRGYIQLWVNIKLGREPITKDFVPVGLLSPVVQETGQNTIAVPAQGNYLAENQFTWPLEKPLWVPPTEQLIIRVMLLNPIATGGGSPLTMQTFCAVAGRSMPDDAVTPDVVHMPWAAGYITPSPGVTNGATAINTTTETDLNNPFNQPMHVHRLTGRGYSASFGEMNQGLSPRTLVRCIDSNGSVVIKDPTPFQAVFNNSTRSWAPRAVLSPKGFYLFEIDQDYTDVVTATSQGVAIGMLGHREVRLR